MISAIPRTTTRIHAATAAQTEAFGAGLARSLKPGWTVHLYGELGAGKTTLVRGALRELGYRGPVRSPTYTLVEPYPLCGLTLYHMDLYRLEEFDELEGIGVREYLGGSNVCFIEWPQHAALPEPDVRVCISVPETGRDVEYDGPGIPLSTPEPAPA